MAVGTVRVALRTVKERDVATMRRQTMAFNAIRLFILLISVSMWKRERELWMRPRTLEGWRNEVLPETVQHQKNLQYLSANVRPFWRWNDWGRSRREENELNRKRRRPKATATASFRLLTALSLLLIMAGDVELNPGPLFTDDYQAVRKALLTVRPQWRNIGLALGIPLYKLNEFSGSLEERIDKMVEVWLNHTYSTPTWEALVIALRDVTVEGGIPVAAEIEAKYGVLSVDQDAHHTVIKACKDQRMVPVNTVQCMFIGHPGGGKTTLKTRLMKEPPSDPGSTGVVCEPEAVLMKQVPAIRNIQVTEHEWIKLNLKQEILHLVERAKKSVSSQITNTKSRMPEQERPEMSQQISIVDPSATPLTSLSEILNDALKGGDETEELLKLLSEKNCTIYFTDTGGQSFFQELLPALISGPTIFFLVFSLEKAAEGLDTKYPEEYRTHDGKMLHTRTGSFFSIKDIIVESLASIAQVCCMEGNKRPRVFLIGTHLDKIDGDKFKEIDKEVQTILETTSHFDNNIIVEASRNNWVFPVNNESPNEDDLQMIRENFYDIFGLTDPSTESNSRREIPLSYLAFDLLLRTEGQEGHHVLEKKQVEKLASDCSIQPAHLEDVLVFLHTQFGVIRYFKDAGLGDIVITHPQIVYKRITEMIVDTLVWRKTQPAVRERFQKSGIFPIHSLIEADKKQENGVKRRLSMEELVKLLEHLDIIAPYDKEKREYFMPAVLACTDPTSDPPVPKKETEKLLVVFKCGYVPKGSFSGLAVYLQANKMKSKYEWSLHDMLFRNLISFTVDDDMGYTHALFIARAAAKSRTVLEVFIGEDPTQLSDDQLKQVLTEIRRCVNNGLMSVLPLLGYKTPDNKPIFDFGFYIKGQRHQDQGHVGIPKYIHSLSMKCEDCSKSQPKIFPLEAGHKVWCAQGDSTSLSQPKLTGRKRIRSDGDDGASTPPKKLNKTGDNRGVSTSRLTRRPKIWDLDKVVRKTQGVWKQLATRLHFETHEVKAIEKDNTTVMQMCREMLGKWLEGQGQRKPRTWATLIEALREMDLEVLANELDAELHSELCPTYIGLPT